jgi:UDP-glucose 4-epimerase
VLITGGLGFIGSNIAHKLVHQGAKVTIIDSLAPLYGGNLTNVKEIHDDIVLYIGDFRNKSLVRPLATHAESFFTSPHR